MLDECYISPFLDAVERELVQQHFASFAQAYVRNSPIIEGVSDLLVEKSVDNLTFTGTPDDIARFIGELIAFNEAGLAEFAFWLYDKPEQPIRLIADRVTPTLQ